MQKVEMYQGYLVAFRKINEAIHSGWRVHTLSASAVKVGSGDYTTEERILVIYERLICQDILMQK